ncbi:SdpI/YhfL protein family protein [uncultured archaeon]|nr:SdpI/YhfL protein family protein [uncultured archaeon]
MKVKVELWVAGLVALSVLVGVYAYPRMPDLMASHWDARGEVNGHMSKFWGVFLLPIVLAGVGGILLVLPRIDPLRKNIESFRDYFDRFIILISLFLFVVYVHTLLWNAGVMLNTMVLVSVGLAAVFYYLGVLLPHAKRNWTVGIRTPWTLSSEVVWDKTHALGGKLYKAMGVIALLGVFVPQYTLVVVVVPIIALSFYLIVYSFLEFRKLEK